ncbi:hypothetical protein WHI96_25395 [Pseudonocardia tropica]|uniref:GNAT family N-acetyltransferase n=1 Tax=Pseudonocardia tropica TaxID=681289 RepID=A0ABV1K1Q1_9PSEU
MESGTAGASGVALRAATPLDVETLHRFIVELAEAESFPDEVEAKPVDLSDALLGPDRSPGNPPSPLAAPTHTPSATMTDAGDRGGSARTDTDGAQVNLPRAAH